MATTKLKIRNDLVKKSGGGETAIYVQYTYKGKPKYFNTGKRIDPEYWDEEGQCVKRAYRGYTTLNDFIKGKRRDVEEIVIDAQKRKIEPTLAYVEQQYTLLDQTTLPDVQKDFLQLFEQFIKERDADPEYSKSTIKHYRTSFNHLTEYSEAKRTTIQFDQIDNRFYDSYKKYLYGLSMQPNTVGNEIKYLKTFLNWATDNKHNTKLDFQKFKKPSAKTVSVVLNQEELNILYAFDLSKHTRLERIRDLFVLGCYTGLRFSDLCNLKPENIVGEFINLHTIKTKDPLRVPITPHVRAIIEKYQGELPKLSNQKANEFLKDLGAMIGMNGKSNRVKYKGGLRIDIAVSKAKLLTTHTARRTFITLALKRGMPQVTLIKITGHKDLRTMQKYVEIAEQDTYDEMMRVFGDGTAQETKMAN